MTLQSNNETLDKELQFNLKCILDTTEIEPLEKIVNNCTITLDAAKHQLVKIKTNNNIVIQVTKGLIPGSISATPMQNSSPKKVASKFSPNITSKKVASTKNKAKKRTKLTQEEFSVVVTLANNGSKFVDCQVLCDQISNSSGTDYKHNLLQRTRRILHNNDLSFNIVTKHNGSDYHRISPKSLNNVKTLISEEKYKTYNGYCNFLNSNIPNNIQNQPLTKFEIDAIREVPNSSNRGQALRNIGEISNGYNYKKLDKTIAKHSLKLGSKV